MQMQTKKNSLKHRPQHALAARVTHLKWLKARWLRSPFQCWRSFESQKRLKLIAATDFCQPVIIYFSLCDFPFLFFLCFFFLSFPSFLPCSSEGSQDWAGASVVAGAHNQNRWRQPVGWGPVHLLALHHACQDHKGLSHRTGWVWSTARG